MALPHCLVFFFLPALRVIPEAAGVARLPEAVKVLSAHTLML